MQHRKQGSVEWFAKQLRDVQQLQVGKRKFMACMKAELNYPSFSETMCMNYIRWQESQPATKQKPHNHIKKKLFKAVKNCSYTGAKLCFKSNCYNRQTVSYTSESFQFNKDWGKRGKIFIISWIKTQDPRFKLRSNFFCLLCTSLFICLIKALVRSKMNK